MAFPSYIARKNLTFKILIASALAVAIHSLVIVLLLRTSQDSTSSSSSGPQNGRVIASFISSPIRPLLSARTEEKPSSPPPIATQKPFISPPSTRPEPVPVYYFRPDEVTQKARVIVDLPIDFSLPKDPKLPQPLEMWLRINAAGDIDEVLINAPHLNNDSRNSIIAAFKSMKFQPAQIGTVPVRTEIPIQVFGTQIPGP